MEPCRIEVWDDSSGWRGGASRWRVVGTDDITVAESDLDYLTHSEAYLAASSAKRGACHRKRWLE